jgi:hypothetical protein
MHWMFVPRGRLVLNRVLVVANPAITVWLTGCRKPACTSASRFGENGPPCKSSVKKKKSVLVALRSARIPSDPAIRLRVCLSAGGPCSRRTGHPFAASSSEEPSQKIEFVSSARPETMRREPREFPPLPGRFTAAPGGVRHRSRISVEAMWHSGRKFSLSQHLVLLLDLAFKQCALTEAGEVLKCRLLGTQSSTPSEVNPGPATFAVYSPMLSGCVIPSHQCLA